MHAKPFSQACENNKAPILEVLQQHLQSPGALLEIGAGTGQHACWIAPQLPHIHWQPSDLPDALPGIQAWLDSSAAPNVLSPEALDVTGHWPTRRWHYLFTANTFHIMPEQAVRRCIEQASQHIHPHGLFLVYGPFRFNGHFTSPSNADFDRWLKARDPRSGIRDAETIDQWMADNGFMLEHSHPMPANNYMRVWRHRST